MATSARTATERRLSRIKAKESQERKNEEEKLLTVKTSRRRQNLSSAKETEQASTSSKAQGEAAVGECKKGAKPLS